MEATRLSLLHDQAGDTLSFHGPGTGSLPETRDQQLLKAEDPGHADPKSNCLLDTKEWQ